MKWRRPAPVEKPRVELFDDWSAALFGPSGEQVSNWYVLRNERTTTRLKGPYPAVATHVGLWRAGGSSASFRSMGRMRSTATPRSPSSSSVRSAGCRGSAW